MTRSGLVFSPNFRRNRLRREKSIADKFVASEKKFERELSVLIAKRKEIEEKFRRIMDMPSAPRSQASVAKSRLHHPEDEGEESRRTTADKEVRTLLYVDEKKNKSRA